MRNRLHNIKLFDALFQTIKCKKLGVFKLNSIISVQFNDCSDLLINPTRLCNPLPISDGYSADAKQYIPG